jgi:uncharacterized protein
LKAALLDTGAIVASLDRSELLHEVCVSTIASLTCPLITCEAVIAESCFLLRNLRGAAEAVIENVAAGIFQLPFSLMLSAGDVCDDLRKYHDIGIDFADACLIQLATDLRVPDILTLDRDFKHYRWGRDNPFRMLIPTIGN